MTAKKEKGVENSVENVEEGIDLGVVIKTPLPEVKKVVNKTILKNTQGKEVPAKDYFFKETEKGGVVPLTFTRMCGYPVDREDLLEVFDRIFKPSDNFLFYKSANKEVYIIIVPLKYSTSVSIENNSLDGDFQKHAISFIGEGSVNLDTLKMKLNKIKAFVNFEER